jgi:hypothetical protein
MSKLPGCKTVLNVVLDAHELTEHERMFTHMPIDAYRLAGHGLPLLDGAARAYYHEAISGWYIDTRAKAYPLTGVLNDYEPYALDASRCYKLAVYLVTDIIPYQVYNSIVELLSMGLNREVWLVDHYPAGQEEQYYLFRVQLVEPFSSTFVTFSPGEADIERFVDGKPIEQDIAVSLYRTQPTIE